MIDYSNKIFEVTKEKTNIKGFWKDAQGTIYKDYIKLYSAENPLEFDNKINDLFLKVKRQYLLLVKLRLIS